jgi:hypothetical protein
MSSVRRSIPRPCVPLLLTLAMMVVAACGGGDNSVAETDGSRTPPQELERDTEWPGFITRTVLINREEGGRHVTGWREERWDNFRVAEQESSITAGLESDWTLTERVHESSEDCVHRREARGRASYPWLMLDLDPFTELEYRIYTGGTGEMETVEGTMHGRCRTATPPEFTAPYETMPSLLPAVPFELPAQYRAPGYESVDATAYGPAITGHIDPERLGLIRGQAHARTPEDGSRVMLVWNLERTGECGEASARARLRQEAAAISRALGDPEATAASQGKTFHPASWSTTVTPPLSAATVTRALQKALGDDYIQITSGTSGPPSDEKAGIVQFGVRVSTDGRILQSLDTIRRLLETTCFADGSLDGARTILAGAVQWTADEDFRVTLRRFDVETGVILDTAKETGSGGGASLDAVVQKLILNMIVGG